MLTFSKVKLFSKSLHFKNKVTHLNKFGKHSVEEIILDSPKTLKSPLNIF